MKHVHTQPQTRNHKHTRLGADAVLISVTAAEPLAAQITAGVQAMEEDACIKANIETKDLCDANIPRHETQAKYTAWWR